MDLKDVSDYTTLSRRTINRAIAEKKVKVSRQLGNYLENLGLMLGLHHANQLLLEIVKGISDDWIHW